MLKLLVVVHNRVAPHVVETAIWHAGKKLLRAYVGNISIHWINLSLGHVSAFWGFV
jgi:hypothetical protein